MSEASSSSDPVDAVPVVNQEPIVTVVIDIIKENAVNIDEVKARHLFDIRADKNLNWLLDDWQKQFKVARDRIETKSTRTNNAKNDFSCSVLSHHLAVLHPRTVWAAQTQARDLAAGTTEED
ncbi:unnamed protein product [Sphagnum jensenii]|uniref:Uncharacterized protein n=1 Tax=Sphagnum jensenii TaxID=128206 RepID=A0ABP0WG48_9BRYO